MLVINQIIIDNAKRLLSVSKDTDRNLFERLNKFVNNQENYAVKSVNRFTGKCIIVSVDDVSDRLTLFLTNSELKRMYVI